MEQQQLIIDSSEDFYQENLKKMNALSFRPDLVEQIVFRIYCCKNCIVEKKCKFCKCNPMDKILEPISCNKKVYPDLTKFHAWEAFKQNHNIVIK